MSILTVSNVSHSFGGRQILENVSFRLLNGEHVGLIGANGEGKSTFLNIITGKLTPEEGKVEWCNRITVGYLDQHTVLQKGKTIKEVLQDAFHHLFDLEKEMMELYEKMCDCSEEEVNQYMQTSVPSVFACGNVVHVNDLVDNVTVESMLAGQYAALYAAGKLEQKQEVRTRTGTNVRYICPQRLMPCDDGQARLFFRVLAPDMDVRIEARCNGKVIASNPGEMCSIKIPLSEVDSDIVVDVIKEA